MRTGLCTLISAALLLGAPAAAFADVFLTRQFDLRLEVPVICNITFESDIAETVDGAWRLGSTRELCNNSRGYAVSATYEPGTLVGAVVSIDGGRTVLDGSGRAVVYASRSAGNVRREVVIAPGAAGFDTEQLLFSIEAA